MLETEPNVDSQQGDSCVVGVKVTEKAEGEEVEKGSVGVPVSVTVSETTPSAKK